MIIKWPKEGFKGKANINRGFEFYSKKFSGEFILVRSGFFSHVPEVSRTGTDFAVGVDLRPVRWKKHLLFESKSHDLDH
jgi:hypothetical protein